MIRRGVATFTLDTGKCPRWLFERMVRLGRSMIEVIVAEYGPDEFIERISDPVWFQSLGTVLAFDWNASGLTTILTASLKESLRGRENDLGLFICGGKGKTSLKTPEEIKRVAYLTNFDQKDLIAIDKTIELIGAEGLEIYFIHASEKNEAWSEVMLAGIKSYFSSHYPGIKTHYALIGPDNSPDLIDNYLKTRNIDLLAFNTRRRKLFSRLFNTGLAYKLVLNSDTLLFITHI